MENYKEKYEEALERARVWKEKSGMPVDRQGILDDIFPELKESRDEKIRKMLVEQMVRWHKCALENNVIQDIKDSAYAIAWLEKQSKPQVRTGSEWVKTIDAACEHRYAEEYAHGEHCHQQSFRWGFQEGVDWLEKQSKQSHCNGEVNDEALQRQLQIWFDKGKCSGRDEVIFHPENFGLQKQGEQKPTWSEEDEIRAAQIISDLEKCTVPGFPVYIGGVELEINWLKSLKERYTWKPSDEQMKQLGWIAEQNKDNMIGKELMSLYQDLKKLREE